MEEGGYERIEGVSGGRGVGKMDLRTKVSVHGYVDGGLEFLDGPRQKVNLLRRW